MKDLTPEEVEEIQQTFSCYVRRQAICKEDLDKIVARGHVIPGELEEVRTVDFK